MSAWKVALPMYAITPRLREANRTLLQLLVNNLQASGWDEALEIVEPAFTHIDEHWLDPQLLLSQTCGYPLTTRLQGHVSLLALPTYRAEGFENGQYSSRLIVAAHSPFASLADLRGAVAAINSEDSHSGMNALRHAVVPLVHDGAFFSEVVVSGGHANSIEYVRNGQADIAAIDPVSWALLLDEQPERLADLRTLGWTEPAPGLPLIGAKGLSEGQILQVRSALSTALQQAPELASTLRLEAFVATHWPTYQRIVDMQRHVDGLPPAPKSPSNTPQIL